MKRHTTDTGLFKKKSTAIDTRVSQVLSHSNGEKTVKRRRQNFAQHLCCIQPSKNKATIPIIPKALAQWLGLSPSQSDNIADLN
jgi:hypothetical protein